MEAALRHEDGHSGDIINERPAKTDERRAVQLLYGDYDSGL